MNMFTSLERFGNFAAVLLLALAAGGCATSKFRSTSKK